MKKRKDIDQLFSEVEEFDQVIAPWKSLGKALNSRLKEARLGLFAGTAIQHVSSGNTLDREELFIRTVRETDLNWRQADFVLERIAETVERGDDIDSFLKDSRFTGDLAEQALDIIKQTDNIYSARLNGRIEGDIAVIQPDMMNELDRSVLPEDAESIDLFLEGSPQEPEMHIFSSTGEIASAVSSNISIESQGDVAVVAKRGSRYWRLTSNMLESRGIEVQRGGQLGDAERKFLNLCEIASTEGRIRSRDVRSIAEKLDLGLEGTYLSSEQTTDLRDFLNVSDYLTFSELLEGFQELYRETPKIQSIIEKSSLEDREITRERSAMLENLLQREKDSRVKLVEPEEAVFLDRSLVFFLGVEASWVDESSISERSFGTEEFLSMIQNGDSQYFMVQEFSSGEKVTPSLHLKEIFDKNGFRSFPHTDHTVDRGSTEFETREIEDWREISTVSQSDLNTYSYSPRAYYFSQLVSGDKEKNQVRGQLLHQYAEYVFSDGDTDQPSKYVELMMNEIESYINERERESIKTEFKIGINAINKLKEETTVVEFDHDMATGDNGENVFSQKFEGSADSSATEAYFRNEDLGAKGKIDLLIDKDHMLDIKTSRRVRTKKDIVKNALPEIETDRPDYQPLMYILESVKRFGDREIDFTYFFTHGAMREDLRGEESFNEKMVTVSYRSWNFTEELQGTDIFEHLIRGVKKDNDRRKTLEKLTLPEFRKFFNDVEIDMREEDAVMDDLLPEFEKFVKKRVGDYRYVEKGCRSAMSKIVDYRLSGFYREDLEEFRDFLQESITEINRYREQGFPTGKIQGNEPFREMIIDGT